MTVPTTATTGTPHTDVIAPALARLHAVVAERPGFGHSTRRSVSTLGGRLRCSTTEGDVVIDSDLAPALGGEATAPGPTALARAALGACLAMTYRLRAAEVGIELTGVRVTVESESDLCGMLDLDAGAPPGFTALHYHVEIESPAPASDVARIVDLGDRLSPVLDMFTRAQSIERTVSIAPVSITPPGLTEHP